MTGKPVINTCYLNGVQTARNYIDECIIGKCSEPDILYQLIDKLNDEGLHGFADCLHAWMKVTYDR